jgi:hypothetical protein
VIALSGLYYFVYSSPSTGYFDEHLIVQIGGPYYNSTDPSASIPAAYYPANFSVGRGEHVFLVVENTDNVTHGMAIKGYNVDSGEIKAKGSATITFVSNQVGNFTVYEPAVDCGGGKCDANASLTGIMSVVP